MTRRWHLFGHNSGSMAAPNPEQELNRLRRTVKDGVPPLLVLLGPATFFRNEAMDLVLERLPDDVDVRTLTGDRETDGEELQGLRGKSLFGSGSWVVVRRAEAWLKQHGPTLATLAPVMPRECGVVIEATKLDRRTKVGKGLSKAGDVFEFRALYNEPYDRSRSPLEAETVGWIVGRAKAMNLSISGEAALLIMATVGTDPAECVAELERIASRAGPKQRTLGPDDLRGMLSCSFESTPFELADAVLGGDRRRALRSLEAMFERGTRGRDGQSVDRGGLFPFIASWLYQSMAKAYEGRFLLDRGVSVRDVAGRVGVRAFVPRYQQQVSSNPEPRLRSGLRLLHEAQRELRLSGEDPLWILRRFVDRYFAGAAS